jgi:hypothetical protein
MCPILRYCRTTITCLKRLNNITKYLSKLSLSVYCSACVVQRVLFISVIRDYLLN